MIRLCFSSIISPKHFLLGKVLQGPLLMIAMLSLIPACSGEKPSRSLQQAVAIVNGQSIDKKEFEKAVREEISSSKREMDLKPEEEESLKDAVLDNMISEKIMLQRAGELSVSTERSELVSRIEEIRKDYGDQFDKLFGEGRINQAEWKEALRKRILLEKLIDLDVNAKIQVTEEEAERYYNANRKAYATERRVRVAQIVLPDRDRADDILKRLKAGEDFGKVARDVSIGPEATRGGDLGFFERGVMPEAIDRMVFSLPVGEVSRVARSPYGFHIFKVLGLEEARGRKFAETREKVITDLRKQKEADAYNVWMGELKAKAVISINRPLPGLSGTDMKHMTNDIK